MARQTCILFCLTLYVISLKLLKSEENHKVAQRTLRALILSIYTIAMVNIVSMATEKTLITHSSEVRQN